MNARDSNKNMFTVDDLIYNMQHFEEENFERFDELYAEVCSGDFFIEKDAVIRICRNFKVPFEEVHPHQYDKAVEITYLIIDKIGKEEGFRQLIEGLSELGEAEKEHVFLYMNMLMFSYGKSDLELFRLLLEKWENNEVIWQAINQVCQINSKRLDAAREVFSK